MADICPPIIVTNSIDVIHFMWRYDAFHENERQPMLIFEMAVNSDDAVSCGVAAPRPAACASATALTIDPPRKVAGCLIVIE
jgi:hypothetical protein